MITTSVPHHQAMARNYACDMETQNQHHEHQHLHNAHQHHVEEAAFAPFDAPSCSLELHDLSGGRLTGAQEKKRREMEEASADWPVCYAVLPEVTPKAKRVKQEPIHDADAAAAGMTDFAIFESLPESFDLSADPCVELAAAAAPVPVPAHPPVATEVEGAPHHLHAHHSQHDQQQAAHHEAPCPTQFVDAYNSFQESHSLSDMLSLAQGVAAASFPFSSAAPEQPQQQLQLSPHGTLAVQRGRSDSAAEPVQMLFAQQQQHHHHHQQQHHHHQLPVASSPTPPGMVAASSRSSSLSSDGFSSADSVVLASPTIAVSPPSMPLTPSAAPAPPPHSFDAAPTAESVAAMAAQLRRLGALATTYPDRAHRVNVKQALDQMHDDLAQLTAQLDPTVCAEPVPFVKVKQEAGGSNGLCVRVVDGPEELWYADRPYPSFNVEVGASTGGYCPPSLRSARVQVSLLDGDGSDASDKLGGPAASHSFIFNLEDGRAEIHGLRFLSVSSKCGGYFQLVLSLLPEGVSPSEVAPFVSRKIQVLSYRLFHSPKVDFDKLSPTDPLSKIKGIGNLYAKRFASLGIVTVQQLAALDDDQEGQGAKALEYLRRDRGAMTLAKLNSYISQAREIVQRYTAAQQ